ncbi:hypothetical protein B0F90DRAFT_1702719 [Multifurca ochricompacta]|uniref:Uncharacterized protein n=1 Tax=Multifurca ochricompacta TaxID=376703 RepID=A0AAD4QMX7_9AGAM|nr:hypothetical protein B0F90DRAFT_1702719 [Multifurca ochricompacta]
MNTPGSFVLKESGKIVSEVMNYDIWDSWSPSSGSNGPLDDSCAASPQVSATPLVKTWTRAGFQ